MTELCGLLFKRKNKNGIKELPKPLPVLDLAVKHLIFGTSDRLVLGISQPVGEELERTRIAAP